MAMTEIFDKSTGELMLGGNVGVLGFDYLSDYAAGYLNQAGWGRFAVKAAIKGLGGAGIMALTSKIPNEDMGQVVLGIGAAPIMTIANDLYKAARGAEVGEDAYAKAVAKRSLKGLPTGRKPLAAARVVRAPAPGAAPTAANHLTLGVF